MPPQGDRGYVFPLLTKTVLFAFKRGENNMLVLDKATGEMIHQRPLPGGASGAPITYMLDGKQHIVVAINGGKDRIPPQLIALTLPKAAAASIMSPTSYGR